MRINILSGDKIFSRVLEVELRRRNYDAVISNFDVGASLLIVDLDSVNPTSDLPCISFSYDGNSDLKRPFAISELVSLLEVRMPNLASHSVISNYTTVCFHDSCTINIDDNVIHMSKQEYLLFELLYKNTGKTVSKADIFDYVWNGSGNDNKLRVYIKYIREKTEPIYKKRVVFSVRDRGYTMKFD